MARKIAERIKVVGTLQTLSPLCIGGMHLDPTIDLALAVNGLGRYYIPGTSLAGAFSNWMDSNIDSFDHKELWGYQEKDQGHASFILIEDLQLPEELQVEIRDGVGIDRRWGAAADRSKFDRAIIPKGVKWDFHMSVEIPAHQKFGSALDALLNALHAGEIRLGAAKTRGLGRVQLDNCRRLTQQLNTKEGMLQALKDSLDQQPANYQDHIFEKAKSNSQLKISIYWEPIGPVMVKDAIEGNTVDILPLMSADGDQLALVLPGSSIKGALRSQAERIIRTVRDSSIPQSGCLANNDDFLNQVQVPLVSELFGAAADLKKPEFGQGALYVEDCFSKKKTERSQWQKVIEASTEVKLREALSDTGLGDLQQAFHVAIDRWTGGAAEHMLYSNLEPFGVQWSPIELTVNLRRLAKVGPRPAIALLLLLLRDLYQQRIPLGYGVNRGMGSIEITKIHIAGDGWQELGVVDGNEFTMTDGSFQGIDPDFIRQVQGSWQEWIESSNTGGGNHV